MRLLRGLLQHALFQLFLAFDAVTRPRHRFQALRVDLFPARDALPKVAFADAVQRPFHHLQELPLVVALVEQEFLVIRAGRPICDVLGRVLVNGAPILLGSRNVSAKFLLPGFQSLFELF